MVRKQSDKRPTGNLSPASRPCTMGQRPHPMAVRSPKDDRGWWSVDTSPKDVTGKPELPGGRSGFRDERLGSNLSHHLNTSVECIVVNVGGSGMDAKVSSPPMTYQSVGGVIVLGARESRVQGEGRQGIDVPRVDISGHMPVNSGATRWTVARYGSGGRGCEPKWDNKPRGNSWCGKSIPGEPCAVKVACTVRRGG